jgi:hypothetical protein
MLLGACSWTEPVPSQELRVEVIGADGAVVRDALCRLGNERGTWTLMAPGRVTVLEAPTPLALECSKLGLPTGYVNLVPHRSGNLARYMMAGGARALTDPRGYAPHRYPEVIRVTLGRSTTQDQNVALK